MKELCVPKLSFITRKSRLAEISSGLNLVDRYTIDHTPWPGFPYKPQVSFSIAYTDDAILLKYFVQENAVRISCHTDNSPVHEDSCVEFFIAFDNDEEYYNLEFNCIGACLFGYGKERSGRQLIGKHIIDKIKRMGAIQRFADESGDTVNWELVLMIPLEVFIHHDLRSLQHRICKVNFYKCGDKLPEPHFLAWKDIAAAEPDFHLPEFFGNMQFV